MIFANVDRRDVVAGTIVLAGAALLGMIVPGYVASINDGYAKLLALPSLIVLATVLVHSRIALLLLMVTVRASLEVPLGSRFSFGGADIGLGGLMNGFAILIAIFLAFEHRDRFRSLLIGIWMPFLAVVVLGTTISPDRGAAIRLCLQLLADFAIFVGAYLFVGSPKDFQTAIRVAIVSSFVPALVGLLEYMTTGGTYDAETGIRIRGTFFHPNVFAFYLLLVVALSLYILKRKTFVLSTVSRLAMSAYLLLLIALLILTKTRSAWGACVALFAAYGVFFERRFLVYLAMFGGLGLLIPDVRDRIMELTQGGSAIATTVATNSLDWRKHLWQSALDWMTPSHYLFGYGAESFPFYAPTFFKEGSATNWGAHNDFVELFFSLGLFGITAFLWMYGRVIWYLRSVVKTDRLGAFILIMLVVEYLIVSTSDNMLRYLTFHWYLWFTLGAGVALSRSTATPGRSDSRPPESR